MEKYIITGGQGFVGSKIVEKTGGESFDLKSGQDILNHSQLKKVCLGATGIFHCAAKISVPESVQNPDAYHRTNVEGTESVISIAHMFGSKIVFSSSAAIYGESDIVVAEECIPYPQSPYAQNKLDGEKLLIASEVPAVILRYFNLYGPGQSAAYAGVITVFMKNALRGEDLVIYGDGTQSRDFIFVDDVVEANIIAMNYKSATCEVFNIASGSSISMLELAEKIIQIAGSRSKISYGPPRLGDIKHSRANISKAMGVLNWKPRTSLDQGLAKTIDYILHLS